VRVIDVTFEYSLKRVKDINNRAIPELA
jgi:hypothetical protein